MSNFMKERFADSIIALVAIAGSEIAASRAAALVLLSAYDSYQFSIPLHEIYSLNDENYSHALLVITARYKGFELHELIPNGKNIFLALYDSWQHLRNSQPTAA